MSREFTLTHAQTAGDFGRGGGGIPTEMFDRGNAF